jgi:hypothetical protein
MDHLISSFSQLNIYEKNIINNIITKNNNNNLDELINSFEKINISNINTTNLEELEELNDSFEKINITENLQKSICSFIDFFKLLRNKKLNCYSNNMNNFTPNWIC